MRFIELTNVYYGHKLAINHNRIESIEEAVHCIGPSNTISCTEITMINGTIYKVEELFSEVLSLVKEAQ